MISFYDGASTSENAATRSGRLIEQALQGVTALANGGSWFALTVLIFNCEYMISVKMIPCVLKIAFGKSYLLQTPTWLNACNSRSDLLFLSRNLIALTLKMPYERITSSEANQYRVHESL